MRDGDVLEALDQFRATLDPELSRADTIRKILHEYLIKLGYLMADGDDDVQQSELDLIPPTTPHGSQMT